MSTTSTTIRYTIIALHTILSISIFLCHLLITGEYVFIALHTSALISFLIYIPATIILDLKRSQSKFTHAGGELAYIVVEFGIWTASAVYAIVVYDNTSYTCTVWPQSPSDCRMLIATAVLSFVQAIAMAVWLLVLARGARIMSRNNGKSMKEVYEISAAKVLYRGDGFQEV